MRIALLTLVMSAGLALPGQAQRPAVVDSVAGTVEGTVSGRFDGEVRLLPYAVVEVTGGRFGSAAIADSTGHYVVEGVPPGEVRLRATHAGHESLTLTVIVPPRSAVRVDLELRTDPLELEPVDVVGNAARLGVDSPDGPSGAAIPELELQALDVTPGVGQPGLVHAVQALPGNDPINATDVLFMRGSTTDLKLVLLDGVPVYTPFHVAGLLRSFDPSTLSRADLHVGGAPARYDGGLTHILDLRTRRARRDRTRASGSLDFLSASAATETPLGARAGLLVSGRSLHDLGSAPLGGDRPYGYRDLLVTFDADPAPGHELTATGFWNGEAVRLDFPQLPDDAEWGNRAASVGYSADVGDARVQLVAGGSGYRAVLPLQPSARPGEPLPPAQRASAATNRGRVVAEASWGPADAPNFTGVTVEHIDARYEARSGTSLASSRASTTSVGAFLDGTRPLARGVTARLGARADFFVGEGVRIAPRAALHWEVGPEALLTVAAGRYHQPTRSPDFEVERTLAEVADEGLDPSELLPVATADHVVLSLDQHLAGRVTLGLEGFWKRYEGLSESPVETVRSSGVDLRVLSSGDDGVVWLGYGMSWFWSTVDLSGLAATFAGRHLLSAGMSGSLGGPLRGEARVAYGAGLPFTSIPFGSAADELASPTAGPPSGEQGAGGDESLRTVVGGLDEEFLRIDLEVHAVLRPTWGGHPWTVRPYLRVLNALDRRDALFYTFQPWRDDSVTRLAERPLLPVLGIAFSF